MVAVKRVKASFHFDAVDFKEQFQTVQMSLNIHKNILKPKKPYILFQNIM